MHKQTDRAENLGPTAYCEKPSERLRAHSAVQLSGDPVPVVYTGEFVAEAVVPKRHVDCAILRARERDGECYPPSRSERRERKQAAKPKPCCTTLSVHISICPSSRSLPSSLIPQGRPGSNRIGRCRSCGRDTPISRRLARAPNVADAHLLCKCGSRKPVLIPLGLLQATSSGILTESGESCVFPCGRACRPSQWQIRRPDNRDQSLLPLDKPL